MSVLSDKEIAERKGMVTPFVDQLISVESGRKVVSYGLSSYGYDIRVANSFKVFTNVSSSLVDPKDFDDKSFINKESDSHIVVPPTLSPWRERWNG